MMRAPDDKDFQRWLRDATLSRDQAEILRADLSTPGPVDEASEAPVAFSREARSKGLDLLTVASYAGALLILLAMAWFLAEGWNSLGHWGVFATTLAYAGVFGGMGWWLRFRRGYPTAGGLLFTCLLGCVPILVFALEEGLGLWPGSRGPLGGWFLREETARLPMEAATLVAGILLLGWVRFPFLVLPVASACLGMALDLSGVLPLDFRHEEEWICVFVGFLMLAASFLADRRFEMDLSFWGYLCGLGAFWGGLVCMDSNDEFRRALFALLNAGLVFLSVYLNCRVFLVFGATGLAIYFFHLADDLFDDALIFPLAAAGLGLGLLLGAVYFNRHAGRLSAALDRFRPVRLRGRA
jgi:hypothetical protein